MSVDDGALFRSFRRWQLIQMRPELMDLLPSKHMPFRRILISAPLVSSISMRETVSIAFEIADSARIIVRRSIQPEVTFLAIVLRKDNTSFPFLPLQHD